MSKYELMLLIDPKLSDDEQNNVLASIEEIISQADGKVEKKDIWGEKKLAYKVNKSETGVYVLYQIELVGTAIKDITKKINLQKNIWRNIFVKQDS